MEVVLNTKIDIPPQNQNKDWLTASADEFLGTHRGVLYLCNHDGSVGDVRKFGLSNSVKQIDVGDHWTVIAGQQIHQKDQEEPLFSSEEEILAFQHKLYLTAQNIHSVCKHILPSVAFRGVFSAHHSGEFAIATTTKLFFLKLAENGISSLGQVNPPEAVLSMAVGGLPSSEYLACGGGAGWIAFYDWSQRLKIELSKPEQVVCNLKRIRCVAALGNRVAFGDETGMITIWKLSEGKALYCFHIHQSQSFVTNLFWRSQNRLLVGYQDGVVEILSIKNRNSSIREPEQIELNEDLDRDV